jgi:hypothetical protein
MLSLQGARPARDCSGTKQLFLPKVPALAARLSGIAVTREKRKKDQTPRRVDRVASGAGGGEIAEKKWEITARAESR